jgi:hypothetical protein
VTRSKELGDSVAVWRAAGCSLGKRQQGFAKSNAFGSSSRSFANVHAQAGIGVTRAAAAKHHRLYFSSLFQKQIPAGPSRVQPEQQQPE